MIRLNLLPAIKQEFLRAKRTEMRVISFAVLSVIISVGLVIVAVLFVYVAQAVHKNILTDSISSNMTKLKNVKDVEKYVTVQTQLANIASLHDKKNITSRVFDIIPKLNPKLPNSVKLTTVNVDTVNSTIMFEGETSSFTGLQTFRDTLENAKFSYRADKDTNEVTKSDLFLSTTIDSQSLATREETKQTYVSFKVTATYNTVLFGRNLQDVTVLVPTKETTQSKQDAPDVFSGSTSSGEGN